MQGMLSMIMYAVKVPEPYANQSYTRHELGCVRFNNQYNKLLMLYRHHGHHGAQVAGGEVPAMVRPCGAAGVDLHRPGAVWAAGVSICSIWCSQLNTEGPAALTVHLRRSEVLGSNFDIGLCWLLTGLTSCVCCRQRTCSTTLAMCAVWRCHCSCTS